MNMYVCKIESRFIFALFWCTSDNFLNTDYIEENEHVRSRLFRLIFSSLKFILTFVQILHVNFE